MTASLILTLRVDPDSGVLDFSGATRMGAFEVGRKDQFALGEYLAGGGIDHWITAEPYAFDAKIAEMRLRRGKPLLGKVSSEFHEAFGRENIQALPDRGLTPQPMLILESCPELR